MVTPETSSKLRLLRSTFPTLDEWGVDLESAIVPGQGSPLAVDDTDWVPVPVSQVAVMGLGSARDHLQAVRVLIEAGQLFPGAQSTLIRGAIVGGAQAVWVLAPEDPATRIDRARMLAEHMHVEHRKYLDVLRRIPPEPNMNTELVAEHVRHRQDELRALRRGDGQRASLNTTEMVKTAAFAAFSDPNLANEADSILETHLRSSPWVRLVSPWSERHPADPGR